MTQHYSEYHRIDPPQPEGVCLFSRDPVVQKAREKHWAAKLADLAPEREEAVRLFKREYVPNGLAETDRVLLKDSEAFDAALADLSDEEYEDGSVRNGLFLFGPSGMGKTRCAVQAAVRLLRYGENVAWWSAYDLKQRLFALRSDAEGKETLVAWLSDGNCALFIDDLGHQITESFLEVLRVVLENRGTDYCPVVTTQFSLDEFVESCDDKGMVRLGEAIARRLYDGCRRIRFGCGKTAATVGVGEKDSGERVSAKPPFFVHGKDGGDNG